MIKTTKERDEILTTIIITSIITAITGLIWYLTTNIPLYMHFRIFFTLMTITTIFSLFSNLHNDSHIPHKLLKIILLCVFIVCLSLTFINHPSLLN